MNDEKKEQREAAAQRSACVCKTPLVKHVDGGVFICATCGKGLLVDDDGKPYRRLRGDLDTLEAARKAKDEMMELVVQLPTRQKEYLLRLSKMKPKKFAKEARRLIRIHFAALESEQAGTVKLGPNAQRRLAREMADAVDALNPNLGLCGRIEPSPEVEDLPHAIPPHIHRCEGDGDECASRGFCKCACGETVGINEDAPGWNTHDSEPPELAAADIARDAAERHAIEQATKTIAALERAGEIVADRPEPERERCFLCGLMKPKDDHDGHGLGECVDICVACGGSGDGVKHPTEGTLPCEHCAGSGAEPPRSLDTERAGPHHDYIDAITYSGPDRRHDTRIIPPENIDPAEPGGDYSPEQPAAPPARTILAGLGINL